MSVDPPPRLTENGVTLEPAGNGIARVSWERSLQDQGFEVASSAVRDLVQKALDQLKQGRVEALVDPGDDTAVRIATWSGMHREGVMRGAVEGAAGRQDRVVFARLESDAPVFQGTAFRALLNSFLPRKRAIAQVLARDTHGRVLLCNLTYKKDWDLPGGVVEINESPREGVVREVEEELGLDMPAGDLLLTDWLPPWQGWDDAVCLVFDGGVHDPRVEQQIVPQAREIRQARFCTLQQIHERCTDFTARRIETALANLSPDGPRSTFSESGRPV